MQVLSTPKSELNYYDRSYRMRSIMKSKQDNDVTYCIGVVYKKMGQDYEVTDRKGVISAEYEIELHDQSNSVQSMMKTRQGNDITDRKVLLYIENETKPL